MLQLISEEKQQHCLILHYPVKNKIFFLLLLFLIFVQFIPAQQNDGEQVKTQPLSEERLLIVVEKDLEDLVKKNNFDYKRAKIQYDQSFRDIAMIWNEIIPDLSGTAAITLVKNENMLSKLWNTYFPGKENPLGKVPFFPNNDNTWHSSLGLNLEINLSAWVLFTILKTNAAYNIGKITFQSVQHQTFNTAKKTFHRLILDKKLLILQQSTLTLAEENYKQAIKRYQNGLIQNVDLIAIQIELENQRNVYEEKNIEYQNNLLTFKLITGIPLEKPINLQGEISINPKPINAEYLLEKHTDKSPQLLLAQAEIWTQRWQTYYQHANIITPFLKFNFDLKNNGTTVTKFQNVFKLSKEWQESFMFTLGLRIQFDSLFPWTKRGASIWKLRDDLKIKNEDAHEKLIKTHIDITKAVNSMNNIQNNIQSLKLAYTLSEKNLYLINLGYNNGVQNFLSVKEAIKSRSTALSNYSRSQFQYYSNLLDLCYLTNLDSKTILEQLTTQVP